VVRDGNRTNDPTPRPLHHTCTDPLEISSFFQFLSGFNVGNERWEDLFEICHPHLEDHALLFNDLHFIMSFLGAKKKGVGKRFVQSLKEYIG
jgi:hypothetical protein